MLFTAAAVFLGEFMSESYVENKPVNTVSAGEKNTGSSAVRPAARSRIKKMVAMSAVLFADTAASHPKIPMVGLQ